MAKQVVISEDGDFTIETLKALRKTVRDYKKSDGITGGIGDL